MKHILNNLSEQEKNSIREQHAGGMKVMTESFSKLLNSKLGDVKPMVSEQPNFGFDVLDMELPNQDKMRNLFLSKDDDIPELKGMSDEVKKVMNACVSENNLYKVKGFLDGIETKKMNFLNTIMANLFDNKLGGKSIGQEFNEFQKCVSKKIGGKLNTLSSNKSISEQIAGVAGALAGSASSNALTGQGKPAPQNQTGSSGNQYKKPPYCKIGQSQGTIVTAQTGTSGPDTSLGETGLALSLNGKEVCLISTKYPQGGYVTRPTTVAKTQNSALPPPDKNLMKQQKMAGQIPDGLRQGDPRKG